jgi:hypothetical protein
MRNETLQYSAVSSRVAAHMNADLDQSSFSLYYRTHPERDPAFNFIADPDPDSALIKLMRIGDHCSVDPPWRPFEPPAGLHFEPLGLHFEPLGLHFERPDPPRYI